MKVKIAKVVAVFFVAVAFVVNYFKAVLKAVKFGIKLGLSRNVSNSTKLIIARAYIPQAGEFGIGALITVVVLVTVMGAVLVALWPTIISSNTSIQALTQTDAGTTVMKGLWPIVLIVVGAGAAVGVIIWALNKFGLV